MDETWMRPDHPPVIMAVARMRGSSQYPQVEGTVTFHQGMRGVVVMVELANLPVTPTGFFALHLHENPCGSPLPPEPYSGAGGHYNPAGQPHPRHAGDFPSVLRLRDGTASLRFLTDRFRLRDVIGRSVVLHLGVDDFTTQPAGNAGPRIACGEIALR